MNRQELKAYLDQKVDTFNNESFIQNDPIQIPHLFDRKEDVEIIGFLVTTIAWGKRSIIINNGHKLIDLLENQPYNYVLNYSGELKDASFVHRTFNSIDLDFFLRSLQNIYLNQGGLESIFPSRLSAYEQINHFREAFLKVDHEKRSEKHLPNPLKGSSAKRINMFLRWMVRDDNKGVDFGLWKKHDSAQLCIPLDVHTGNTARTLGLISRKQNDWKALEELMSHLKAFDPVDPCKYDYALFGLSETGELNKN